MNSGSYLTDDLALVLGITTLVGLGGSFFNTGFGCGLIDTSDFGSLGDGFLGKGAGAGAGAGAGSGLAATVLAFTGSGFLASLTFGAGFFATGFGAGLGAGFLAAGLATALGAGLATAFFGAAFLGAAFLGAAFLAAGLAAFLGAGFLAAGLALGAGFLLAIIDD